MATGALPFRGESTGLIFDAILNQPAIAPARLNPEVTPDLERIINKALEKDRNLRYQSAAEIRTDLQRLKRDTASAKKAPTNAAAKPRRFLWLRLAAALLAVIAIAGAFAWRYWPGTPPRVLATTQITSDGVPKTGLLTDGSRL